MTKTRRSMIPAARTAATTVLAAVALATAPLRAQGPTTESHSSGPFIGVPHGLSVDSSTFGPTGRVDETALLLKASGFLDAAPTGWALPMPAPDFSAAAILQGVSPRPDIDAFSVGLDWVLSDNDGQVEVPPGHWGALTLSVTRQTKGVPGGVIESETRRPDGAAADVFSYILPGSELAGIPPRLVDVTERAQDSEEIDIYRANLRGDIDAHDLFVRLVYVDNPAWVALLPPEQQPPTVFFSVNAATVGRVPVSWWLPSVPSGATILMTTWVGGAWTTPTPFLTFTDLGLQVEAEIDAVAVDRVRKQILFSTTDGTRDPILWASYAALPATVRVYRMKGTQEPVSRRIGLLTGDDADAICSLDPAGGPVLPDLLGTSSVVPGLTPRLSVSTYRVSSPNPSGGMRFQSYMTGWPPSGRGAGSAVCLLGLIAPTGWIPLSVLPQSQRNPSNRFGGDPRLASTPPIPSVPAMSGLPIFFWWGAVDQSLLTFQLSHLSHLLF